MLQVARLARNQLADAAERVGDYFRGQIAEAGGARDRSGAVDLYYTVFNLEGLVALQLEPPWGRVRPYLENFGDGDGLDLVHLASLARCWAAFPRGNLNPGLARRLADRIGGFRVSGSVYEAFLAFGAHQDLGVEMRDPAALARSVASLQLPDGSFPRDRKAAVGSTPTTAAAVTLLRNLGAPVSPASGDWLLRRAHPQGGFTATEGSPIPDLLSTATALHALAGMQRSCSEIKDQTLDFLDSLWTGSAFCGTWADDVPDCEYTYYALLAMGHLSLA